MLHFLKRYDPVSDTWTSLAEKPTVVTGAPAISYNGELYLFGGNYSYEGQAEPNIYDVVEAYDISSDSWRVVTNTPKKLRSPAVAKVNNKVYLMGGYSVDEEQMSQDVMVFNLQTEQWDTNSCTALPYNRARAFEYTAAAPVWMEIFS